MAVLDLDKVGMGSKVLRKTTPPGSPTAAPTPGQAAPTPAARVSPLQDKEFMTKLVQMSKRIGADPLDLIAIMRKESTKGMDPAIVMPVTGATGLLQITPDTAKDIGYTTEQIGNMTPVEQLKPIEDFFNYKRKIYEGLRKKDPSLPELGKFDLKTLYSTVLTGTPYGKENVPDVLGTTVNKAMPKLTQDRAQMTPIPESMVAPTAAPAAPAKEGGGFIDTIKGIFNRIGEVGGGIPAAGMGLQGFAPPAPTPAPIVPVPTPAPIPPKQNIKTLPDVSKLATPAPGRTISGKGIINDGRLAPEATPTPSAPPSEPAIPEAPPGLEATPPGELPIPAAPPMPTDRPRGSYDDTTDAERQEMGEDPAPGTPGAPSGIPSDIPPAPPGLGGSTPPITDLQGVANMGKPMSDANFRNITPGLPPESGFGEFTAQKRSKADRRTTTETEESPYAAGLAELVASMKKEREAAGKPTSLTDYYGEVSATADKDRAANLAKFMEAKDEHSKKQMWDTIIQALGGAAAGTMNLTMKGPGGYALDVAKHYKPTPVYDRKYEDELSAKEMEQRNIPIGERVKALLAAKEKDSEQQVKSPETLMRGYELLGKMGGQRQTTKGEDDTLGTETSIVDTGVGARQQRQIDADLKRQEAENKARKELAALEGPKGSNLQGPVLTQQDADKANETMLTRLGNARQVTGKATTADQLFEGITKTTGGSLPLTKPSIQSMWKAAEKYIQSSTGRTQIPSQEIVTKILDVLTNHFTTPRSPKELQMRRDTSDRYGIPMPSSASNTYLNTATGKTTVITPGQ